MASERFPALARIPDRVSDRVSHHAALAAESRMVMAAPKRPVRKLPRRPGSVPPRPVTKDRVPEVASTVDSTGVKKLVEVCKWTEAHCIGRSDVVRATALAFVAQLNALYLGEPGTAKTRAVQMIARSFTSSDEDVFDILMDRFVTRSELVGPTDMAAMEKGQRRILSESYLPSARVGIIDECFKSSSAALNTLLRLANERTWRNGDHWERSRLRMMVGMSNELPEDPIALAAFFDRFPIKLRVAALDDNKFRTMLGAVAANDAIGEPPARLDEDDIAEIDDLFGSCRIGVGVLDALTVLRATLRNRGVMISDRRWVQATKVLRASAVLAGRSEVGRADFHTLAMVCWNTFADSATIATVLPDFLNPFERSVRAIADEVYAMRKSVLDAANIKIDGQPIDSDKDYPNMVDASSVAATTLGKIKRQRGLLDSISSQAETDEDRAMLARTMASFDAIGDVISSVCAGRDAVSDLVATVARDI